MTVTITTRASKGAALTYAELDANFTALKAAVEALQSGTSAGSASTPWTPSNLASLAAWWDASDTANIVASSGVASSWTDKVGKIAATNSTAAQQPAYSASALNSLPGFTFDGVDDRLAFPTNSVLPTGSAAITIGIVLSSQQAADMAAFTFGAAGSVGGWVKVGEDGTSPNGFIGDLYAAGVTDKVALSGTSRIGIFQAVAQDVKLYMNGGAAIDQAFATSVGTKNTNGSSGLIGMDIRVQGWWKGVIQQIVVLNAIPSDADRQKLEGYLAAKCGLQGNLPSSHPYKAAAPTA